MPSYSMSDNLSKDAGGAKFQNWIDLATSQLDMALPGGIGSKTTGSKIVAALWSGNGLAGCKVEPTGGVGNLQMVHFASSASPTAAQNGIHVRGNDRGESYQSQIATTASPYTATSHDVVTTSSGILYRFIAAGCGVVAGAQIRVMNGAASLTHLVYNQANDTLQVDFGPGACFGNLSTEKFGSIGPVYITAIYRVFGQAV